MADAKTRQTVLELRSQGFTYDHIATLAALHPDAVRSIVRRSKTREEHPEVSHQPVPEPEELTPEEATAKVVAEKQARERELYDRRVYDQLVKKAAAVDEIVEKLKAVVPIVPKAATRRLGAPETDETPQTAVALLSDLHAGQNANAEETLGLGEFNIVVLRRRVENYSKTIRSIVAHHRRSHPVNELALCALGDLIENITIFAAQKGEADEIFEQAMACLEILCQLLLDLLDTFQTIHYLAVGGNHGRFGRKGEFKDDVMNWDLFLGRLLEWKLGAHYSERIKFYVPRSPMMLASIEGKLCLLRHGHGIKSWAGIPFYGLQRSAGKQIQMMASRGLGLKLDYVFSGHLHDSATIPFAGGEWFLNASAVGPNDYSTNVIEAAADPTQWLLMFHPKIGVGARYRVLLDRPGEIPVKQPPIVRIGSAA